ncbi:MAG: hypothetical protein MIO92_15310 [Methanosarcinaceae archaeon]|nr:hypothetical protein [Methanosarcinaceae archaeon]
MKKLLTILLMALLMGSAVQAAGLTFWGITEQISSVNEDNSLTARIGYDMSLTDKGGLEIFTGSIWRPREGEPQVLVFGAVQHMPDLIDPNSSIPYLPELFLTVISEKVQIRPYIGGQFSINLIDENAGTYGVIAGITLQLTPEANSQLVFEASYDKNFGDLAGVPDNQLKGYMGFRIPF